MQDVKSAMKVYTCTNFEGVWPVGTAAVIVAASEQEAKTALIKVLKDHGLSGDAYGTEEFDLIEINVNCSSVIILRDGNY